MSTYREEINSYLEGGMEEFDLINELYFSYPMLKITKEQLAEIKREIHNELDIPHSSIWVIGSAHTGFSIYKDTEFDEEKVSDIDIVVIDKDYFYKLQNLVIKETKGMKDRSFFKNNHSYRMYQFNISRGYIRGDFIINSTLATKIERICEDLNAELEREVHLAFYLNDEAFRWKNLESLNKYTGILAEKGEKNGN